LTLIDTPTKHFVWQVQLPGEAKYRLSYTFGFALAVSQERGILVDSKGNTLFELPNTTGSTKFAGELFHSGLNIFSCIAFGSHVTFFKDSFKVSEQDVQGDVQYFQGGDGLNLISLLDQKQIFSYEVVDLKEVMENKNLKVSEGTTEVRKTENFLLEVSAKKLIVRDTETLDVKESIQASEVKSWSEDDFILYKSGSDKVIHNLKTGKKFTLKMEGNMILTEDQLSVQNKKTVGVQTASTFEIFEVNLDTMEATPTGYSNPVSLNGKIERVFREEKDIILVYEDMSVIFLAGGQDVAWSMENALSKAKQVEIFENSFTHTHKVDLEYVRHYDTKVSLAQMPALIIERYVANINYFVKFSTDLIQKIQTGEVFAKRDVATNDQSVNSILGFDKIMVFLTEVNKVVAIEAGSQQQLWGKFF
jgi:hypothetical protein